MHYYRFESYYSNWIIYSKGHYLRDFGMIAQLWRPGNDKDTPQLIAGFKIKNNVR